MKVLRVSLQEVRQLLKSADHLELSHGARQRLLWFAFALTHRGNVSLTCRHFGIARSTLIRWAKRFDPKDPESLEEESRRPHAVRQPETDAKTIALIRAYRERHPTLSKHSIQKLLRDEHGIHISSSTVGRVITRRGFFFADTPSHREKRLNASALEQVDGSLSHSSTDDERCVGLLLHGTIRALQDVLTTRAVFSDTLLHKELSQGHSGQTGHRASPSLHQGRQGEGGETHSEDREHTGGSESMSAGLLTVFLGALLLGGALSSHVFAIPERAQAAESSSFKLYDEFPNYAERGPKESSSFKLNEDGVTWESKPIQSTSFQLVTAPPVAAAQEPPAQEGEVSPPPHGGRRPRPPAEDEEDLVLPRVRGVVPQEPSESPWAPELPSIAEFLPDASTLSSLPPMHFFEVVDSPCPIPPTCPVTQQSPDCPGDVREPFHPVAAEGDRAIAYLLSLVLLAFLFLIALDARRRLRRNNDQNRRPPLTQTSLFLLLVLTIASGAFLWSPARASAATTVPLTHVYNGHLLNSAGNAVTTAHTIRFSHWTSTNFVTGDVTATGAINTGAATYVGWQEVHTVTPNSQGYFSVTLGSITPLPAMGSLPVATLQSLFLQVEVKASAAADTAYELLDRNPSDDAVDRSPVLSVPFAMNADLLDQHDVGTASGSIPILGSGGTFELSGNRVMIDSDNSSSTNIELQFGKSLAKKLSYQIGSSYFNFNDDVNIQGDLTVTGLINGVDITNIASSTGALKVASGGGLTVQIDGGSYRLRGNITNFPGNSGIPVTANTTNYVFFTSTGTQVTASGFPNNKSFIPLAQVVTNASSVTNVEDRRVLTDDDRERTIQQIYHAEHEHASYQGDASDNVGRLYVSHDNIARRNFYLWTSTLSTIQDYDINVRVTLPADFVRWVNHQRDENPVRITYRSTSADSANNQLDVFVFDTNGVPVSLSGSSLTGAQNLVNTSWTTEEIEFTGSPTWTPGQDFLIRLRPHARSNFQMHTGDLTLEFVELPSE